MIVFRKKTEFFIRIFAFPTVLLNGVYEGPGWAATGGDAALLREEVVGVAPAPTVREEQASLSRLVEVEAGHVPRADPFVLHQRALV